jgi:hypothetical protein
VALSIAILMAAPAFGVEVRCDTPTQSGAQRAGGQRDDSITLDEELVLRRKQTREADLARVRRQLERSRSQTGTAPSAPPTAAEHN